MENLKDLFYSEAEQILFYVAGYTDNSDNVVRTIKMLNDGVNRLIERWPYINREKVKTMYITKSSRYKYMRVFYVEVKISKAPSDAFKLGSDWTMDKWLHN